MKPTRFSKKEAVLAALIVLEFAATLFDALCNDSRIIQPIETATYRFRPTDLPLLLATAALALYVVWLAALGLAGIYRKRGVRAAVTRRVDPRFGFFGLFGFLGLLGIPSYLIQQQVWPFFFFAFFGFFGFYYEGKLSNTLMDERYREEKTRADLIAYKTGFTLCWLAVWCIAMLGGRLPATLVAAVLVTVVSLSFAVVAFLSSYLLYKYDTEET